MSFTLFYTSYNEGLLGIWHLLTLSVDFINKKIPPKKNLNFCISFGNEQTDNNDIIYHNTIFVVKIKSPAKKNK